MEPKNSFCFKFILNEVIVLPKTFGRIFVCDCLDGTGNWLSGLKLQPKKRAKISLSYLYLSFFISYGIPSSQQHGFACSKTTFCLLSSLAIWQFFIASEVGLFNKMLISNCFQASSGNLLLNLLIVNASLLILPEGCWFSLIDKFHVISQIIPASSSKRQFRQ